MTFEDAHQQALASLDAAYSRLRAVHVDKTHVNEDSKDAREARQSLRDSQATLWRLKQVWAEARG